MPCMHLLPVPDRKRPETGIYRCPILSRFGMLSTTGHSTNFVLWIEVPSDKPMIINDVGFPDQDT